MLIAEKKCDLKIPNEGTVERIYHRNGKLWKETPYVSGKKNGIEKEYLEDGQLISETPYVNDQKTGLQKVYYMGHLQFEIPYINDRRHGTVKRYLYDGKVSAIRYEDGEPVNRVNA